MPREQNAALSPRQVFALPQGVRALGFVSLFIDMSSEMIHSLLPVFLVSMLGASPALVGLIEGLGEAKAPIAKLFSGWASDRLGRRKWLALFGYALALVCKPLFAVAPNAAWVLVARLSDRLAKGVRGAPRDALDADLTRRRNGFPQEGFAFSRTSATAILAAAIVALILLILGSTRAHLPRGLAE